MRYNVVSVMPDGTLGAPLLGDWLGHSDDAFGWAQLYKDKYVGKAYPNGKGHYPWTDFIVVILP